MKPTDQIAEFSGGTDDLSTSGLWYSHKRVAELLEALRQECRDRGAVEADVRARLADAEKTLGRVEALAEDWERDSAAMGFVGMIAATSYGARAADLRRALGDQP